MYVLDQNLEHCKPQFFYTNDVIYMYSVCKKFDFIVVYFSYWMGSSGCTGCWRLLREQYRSLLIRLRVSCVYTGNGSTTRQWQITVTKIGIVFLIC